MATVAAEILLSPPGIFTISAVLALIPYLLLAIPFMSHAGCEADSGDKKYNKVLFIQLPLYAVYIMFIYKMLSNWAGGLGMFSAFL